jgi:ABC-type multidrug transport system fused ATPase/permease subunit
VVDGGRVVQQGTHAELVEQDGKYRELFRLQYLSADNG